MQPEKKKQRMCIVSALTETSIRGKIKTFSISSDNSEVIFAIDNDGEDQNITLKFEDLSGACRVSCDETLSRDAIMVISKIQEAFTRYYQKNPDNVHKGELQGEKSCEIDLDMLREIDLGCFTIEEMDRNVKALSAYGLPVEIEPTIVGECQLRYHVNTACTLKQLIDMEQRYRIFLER